MIKTTAMLKDELQEYVNPTAKIRRLVDGGELIPIVRGLYETDGTISGYYLEPIIYGPSYLSFEFALGYHSLIPEAVYNFRSATFEKKKTKQYSHHLVRLHIVMCLVKYFLLVLSCTLRMDTDFRLRLRKSSLRSTL